MGACCRGDRSKLLQMQALGFLLLLSESVPVLFLARRGGSIFGLDYGL